MELHRSAVLGLSLTLALTACGSSEEPDPGPTADGNDTFATATPLAIGTPVTGSISRGSAVGYGTGDPVDSDPDYFAFTVPAGGATIRFRTFDSGGAACDPAGEGVDPHLDVYDAAQGLLATDDDSALTLLPTYCEDLTLALAEGPHYVLVRGWPPVPFTYTLNVALVP